MRSRPSFWKSAKNRPDSVYWLGSAKFTNEAAYLTEARRVLERTIPITRRASALHHSHRVANTLGLRAMTNATTTSVTPRPFS